MSTQHNGKHSTLNNISLITEERIVFPKGYILDYYFAMYFKAFFLKIHITVFCELLKH